MRPVPRSRHLVALAIFVAVAALYAYLAATDYRMDDEQFHLATAALRREKPELLRTDLIYGRSRMWQAHPPMFLAILETILSPSDYRDLTLPFRILVGILTLVYLCGMYALLRRQCRRYSEQTLATTHWPSAAGSTVGRQWPASFTRASASSAFLRFSWPRIRWPSSSNRATRFFVPGGV